MQSDPAPRGPLSDAKLPQIHSRGWSLANLVRGRHTVPMALLLMFPVLFSTALSRQLKLVNDPDIWWHLMDARQFFADHHVIRTLTSSFTVAGQPWVNPEWLSEIPYWLGYRALELRGVYLVTWLVISATLVCFYWRGYLRSRHPGGALLASALGLVLITVNLGPRTIAIAYLALAAEMMILEAADRGRPGLLWFLPPLFCLWVNLHGSWLIGIGLLVLYALCGSFTIHKGIFDQQASQPADRRRLFAVLCASFLSLFANPYGWRLVWNPFDMMLNQRLNISNVQEWKPLDLSSPAGATAVAAICFMVVANSLKGRKWRVYEMAVVLFAWYAALSHMRFLFLAAVLTVPFYAEEIVRAFDLRPDTRTAPVKNAIIVAAAIGLVVFIFPSEATLEKRAAQFFPVNSIAAIQPSWRTFNDVNVGGRMAFQSKPSFIDTRFDIFEHRGIMLDYFKVMYLVDPLKTLDRYGIDHVLVRGATPLGYVLLHTLDWQVIHSEQVQDGTYLTFAKTADSSPRENGQPAR
ncbi:MAG TPA: hypothetical protein VG267_21810 [Terracidiphilus sp.]|jgi:hypothetical protein|nr:hypothetical protein [Terracidiphilus sp.]